MQASERKTKRDVRIVLLTAGAGIGLILLSAILVMCGVGVAL